MAGFTHGMSNIELDVCEKNVLILTPIRESHSKDKPGRRRRMEPALAPEKGPTLWGGPAESSVPIRVRDKNL